jgi:hypothetical protein
VIGSFVYAQHCIIGGKNIDIQTAPWVANIRVVNIAGIELFDRSGVIVSENMVITASHSWPDYQYRHIAVHVGTANGSGGQYRQVHRTIHHPVYDFAILELSEPLIFNKYVQSIDYRACIDESLYAPGINAVVYGWGAESVDGQTSNFGLRAAEVKIISRQEANAIIGATIIPENTIVSCGDGAIRMAGKGDSGGPLVVTTQQKKPTLAGITVLADTRSASGNSSLTVYEKVKHVIEWIDANKCEIVGGDTVPSMGMRFEIANIPPDVEHVEWTYSNLSPINVSTEQAYLIASDIETVRQGIVSAVITTRMGTVIVSKNVTVLPRIDVDIHIKYNPLSSKYEMRIKPVNLEPVNNNDFIRCKNVSDNIKVLGFVWTFEKQTEIGSEAIFDINPHSPKMNHVSVCRYDCDYTLRLDKTFVVHAINNQFLSISNGPGIITIDGTNTVEMFNSSEQLRMTYSTDVVEQSTVLRTSKVIIEKPRSTEKCEERGSFRVSVFSLNGTLLDYNYYYDVVVPFNINTLDFGTDICILHVEDLKTGKIASRLLMLNL